MRPISEAEKLDRHAKKVGCNMGTPQFIVTRRGVTHRPTWVHKANLALESLLYAAEAKPRLPTCTSSSQPDFSATGRCLHQSEGQDETHDTSNDVLSAFNSAHACNVRPRISCTARTFLYHPVRPKLLLHLRRTLFTHSIPTMTSNMPASLVFLHWKFLHSKKIA